MSAARAAARRLSLASRRMPKKMVGNNWLELRHAPSSVALCFDTAGALRQWALLSLELLDDRRSDRPDAWSGWTCDRAKLRATWAQSAFGDNTSYTAREEWDWAFKTDYDGTILRGADAAGSCPRLQGSCRSTFS